MLLSLLWFEERRNYEEREREIETDKGRKYELRKNGEKKRKKERKKERDG